jgi:hypothetical protein
MASYGRVLAVFGKQVEQPGAPTAAVNFVRLPD